MANTNCVVDWWRLVYFYKIYAIFVFSKKLKLVYILKMYYF